MINPSVTYSFREKIEAFPLSIKVSLVIGGTVLIAVATLSHQGVLPFSVASSITFPWKVSLWTGGSVITLGALATIILPHKNQLIEKGNCPEKNREAPPLPLPCPL